MEMVQIPVGFLVFCTLMFGIMVGAVGGYIAGAHNAR